MVKKSTLDAIVEEFQKPRSNLNGESYQTRRLKKFGNRFQGLPDLYSKDHLPELTMKEAEQLYVGLRTGSKGSRTRKMSDFRSNDIQSIRESLYYVLYGDDSLHKRFSEVVDTDGSHKIHGGGHGFVSTLLHSFNPTKYAVWNNSAKNGLKALGLFSLVQYENTTGKKYQRLNELMKGIAKEYEFDDLSIVDDLLHQIDNGNVLTDNIRASLAQEKKIQHKPLGSKTAPPRKEAPPESKTSTTTSLVRDSKVVSRVKEAESCICEVCGVPIELLDGSRYCEVHHIKPLSEGGFDEDRNVLCLCPNHHVEMERGLFYVEPITKAIVHFDEANPLHGRILLQNQNPRASVYHEIDHDSLVYHRDTRCNWA